MRRLAVGLAMVAMTIPSPLAAATPGPVTIGAETVVTTATSGRIDVDVPAGATLSADTAAGIDGESRFAGVLLDRFDDPDSFSLSAVRYPSGHRWTSITVDRGDEEPSLTSPLTGGPGFRACAQDCPIPPGRYTLIVVADAAPVTVTLRIDGLAGSVELGEDDLAPVAIAIFDEPQEIAWGSEPPGSLGTGSMLGTSAVDAAGAVVFSEARTVVTSNLAGRLEVAYCAAVDGRCAGSTIRHLFVANTVEGTEQLLNYGRSDVGPGRHGHLVTFDYHQSGGGSFIADHRVLIVYPWTDGTPYLGVRGVATPFTVEPGEPLVVEYTNFGTVPVLYGSPYRYEREVAGGWVPVDPCPICAWTDEGYVLKPGQSASHETPTVGLAPGRHRIIKEFTDHSDPGVPHDQRERIEATAYFRIGP